MTKPMKSDAAEAWRKVVARLNGQSAQSTAADDKPKGWAKVIARVNKINRPTKERAPAGGVKMKSSMKVNAGRW